MVVIGVIVLILALAVPGLSVMNAEARMTAATQTVNGTLTRAFYLAVSDVNMTAVRFLPANWDVDPNALDSAGRQHLAIYSYTGLAYDPDFLGGGKLRYEDYLIRHEGTESIALPADVWAAPLEALSDDVVQLVHEAPGTQGSYLMNPPYRLGQQFVLTGQIGTFNVDAGDMSPASGRLLNADDFLIVIDPKSGVQARPLRPFRMRAFNPVVGYDVDDAPPNNPSVYFQRYGFGGVVMYRRQPFVALGVNAAGRDRQAYLQQEGRPFVAQRYNASLTAAIDTGAP
jgi:hypothetical protein